MTNEEPPHYRVWAIEYEYRNGLGGWDMYTVAVSAESEYGAIKRLCGSRPCCPRRVELIEGRDPKYPERYIEGYVEHTFTEGLENWVYTEDV